MPKLMITILITVFLASCATVPRVTISYYPAKWNTVATMTQTVGCNQAKTRIVVANVPSVTTTYSSDFNNLFQINIKDFESAFADSDFTMTFTDDGRLKTINQSTTGQGETIVKSAVALATPFFAGGFLTMVEGPIDECETIEIWGDKKPVTLSYKATIDSTTIGKTVPLDVALESKDLYERIKNRLPKLTAAVSNVSDSKSGPSYETPHAGASDDVVLLTLQKMGSVGVTFSADDETVGTARIVIPETGTYQLPIPKAAFFGKQTFALSLSEAGAVTSVSYGKSTGTAGALNALGAIANVDTAATKAAELKAQADLIAQQQRLVLCKTKPDQCK